LLFKLILGVIFFLGFTSSSHAMLSYYGGSGDPGVLIKLIAYLIPTVILATGGRGLIAAMLACVLGDHRMRKISYNPVSYLDPTGSLVFLLFGMGWSLPVNYSKNYFKRPMLGKWMIHLCTSLWNFWLVFFMFFLFKYSVGLAMESGIELSYGELTFVLSVFSLANLITGLYSLLPVFPMEGYGLAEEYMPPKMRYKMESWKSIMAFLLVLAVFAGKRLVLYLPLQLLGVFERLSISVCGGISLAGLIAFIILVVLHKRAGKELEY
jgi:Zn-dependent protease